MLMRILIPFIILSCIVCCRTKELRIPDQPGLSHLASPVFLKSDTTWVDLKDYFLYPEKNYSVCRCKVVLGQNGLYVRSNCRGFRCVIIRDEHPLRGI